MKIEIVNIENRIVTCKIKDSETRINIAKRWFTDDILIGDTIELDIIKEES